MGSSNRPSKTIIVEHLDPELDAWQTLEYSQIHRDCKAADMEFIISGTTALGQLKSDIEVPRACFTGESVAKRYPSEQDRKRICLLDPKAEQDLAPEDGEEFDGFLFGGILGDDPPRDRTAELRALGFGRRRLGTEQMTTDTAARVTIMVVSGKHQLDKIPYVERPDIEIELPGEEETTGDGAQRSGPKEIVSMPFRYVKGDDGKPIMPKGMLDLLAQDADKGILDLL